MILFSLGYYYIPQKGVQDMRARVVAANHVTWIDAVYFMAAGSFSVVSKRGNAKGCLIGSIVRVQQPMLVDRDKTKKTKTLGISDIILNRTKDDRWPRILIFPQATTTRADCLTSFRTGGFRANSYVQGVALRYDIEPCCSCVDGLDVSWTNETPMLTVYLRLLLNCWNGLSVTWLPVLIFCCCCFTLEN
jgi:lysophosphatidylcholine acyltransferase/lyso-PAF acetyltransferase